MTGNKRKATIGITMGDPAGIGPEIILKGYLKGDFGDMRIIVVGDGNIMQHAYELFGDQSLSLNRISRVEEARFTGNLLNILHLQLMDMRAFHSGRVSAESGHAAYECIRKAVELASRKQINGIVTAPLNKEALQLAGHSYPGHTEILAALTGTEDYAMLLYHKKLSVIHVSTHVSLLDAITGLRTERIEKVIMLADKAMTRISGRRPVIAVAGLNPHAGENGLFGREEIEKIIPAIRKMKDKGFRVEGPFPPDTVYLKAADGQFDVVVAMYHDQGHIPLKLLGFHSGVNVTVGLPFIRTSVDHGTAFDISWQGMADSESIEEAVRLALELTRH